MSNATNTQHNNEYTDNQKKPDAAVAEGTEQPLISVIVPVYNTAELLPRCIDSILNQTHSNLELILVNDNSTDGSGDVCDEYAKKDARVRVIHKQNEGNSAARNTGLDAMTGEWFAVVDSDDYIDLQMYEKLLNAATLQNTYLSSCGYIKKQKKAADKAKVFLECPPKITASMALEYTAIGRFSLAHWAMLYHRKLINEPIKFSGGGHERTSPLRYDTAIHRGGDTLFLLEAILRAGELAYIPEVLYIYDCTRDNNVTNSPISEKKITGLIARKKVIELAAPISPSFAQNERLRLARVAFSAMIETLLCEDANLNALYPECRKAAKGSIGLMLTDKRIKLKSKIVGCTSYLFPRFAQAAWKIRGSLRG